MYLYFLRVCFFVLILTGLPLISFAQIVISGNIKDKEKGEALIGATVFVNELKKGTNSDPQGNYSLSVPKGTYTISFSYLGYETVVKTLTVTNNQKLSVSLISSSSQLTEVVVEAGSLSNKLRTTQMSVETLSSKEAKLLPALFGEVDLLKTLQLKPGVQSGSEGTSGLYVRGGGPDQNLFMIDDAIVYNASHLFGFFSIFNADAVENVNLYKGGFPAQYGGRLSSVVDFKMREGNKQETNYSGGIGLISSRLTAEGPIQKGKSSYLISGRRTYFDVFTRQYNKINKDKKDFNPIPDYYFYDLNGKLTFDLGEKDKLYLTGYYGRDVFGFNNENFSFTFDWGNTVGSIRWNHKFNSQLFLNTTVSVSDYQYNIGSKFSVQGFKIGSNIRDYTVRTDLDYMPNEKHTFRVGLSATRHDFGVGRLSGGGDEEGSDFSSNIGYKGGQYGIYFSDDFIVTPRLALNYGLRISGFSNDSSFFTGLEPRFSARYNINENVSVKASYTRMMQYVHLVSNSGSSLPTDVWYPSNDVVNPQRSHQAALGISKLFGNGKFLFTNEVYYKWMLNQIDFREGAQIFLNPELHQEFIFGRGSSYGNEIYFEKKTGKTTGWVGYTLAWTNRKFPDINEGKIFPARYDRRHDITAVIIHKLNERIHLTATWVYGTGSTFSVPIGKTLVQDIDYSNIKYIPLYSKERNNYRMAPYHRLDLGMVYKLRPRRGESDLTFSVYNAYSRRNPYIIYIDYLENADETKVIGFQAKQISLFPVIPSITYNFKF